MAMRKTARNGKHWVSKRRTTAASRDVYAALDLGTNNCRMLLAVPNADGFRVIDSFSRIVRLGEGLATTGSLCDDAIERTIDALKVCAGKARDHQVKRIRNVATEACRRAGNGDHFLSRVESETGLSVSAITCNEEAALTVAGCMPLLDSSHPYALIFDIGGGSTEIMWVKQHQGRPAELIALLSMPFGVVTLAEEYGFGAIDNALRTTITNRIDAHLVVFDDANAIAPAVADGQVQMLGTSGTVTTLGAIELALPRYQRSKVDGLYLDLDKVNSIGGQLIGMDLDERARIPCIGRGRADLVALGCTILEAICRRWPATRLRIADRGIREGLLMAMIAADRTAQAATASS